MVKPKKPMKMLMELFLKLLPMLLLKENLLVKKLKLKLSKKLKTLLKKLLNKNLLLMTLVMILLIPLLILLTKNNKKALLKKITKFVILSPPALSLTQPQILKKLQNSMLLEITTMVSLASELNLKLYMMKLLTKMLLLKQVSLFVLTDLYSMDLKKEKKLLLKEENYLKIFKEKLSS